ncbi:MAG: O-antigen ligase family protein [Bacteroidales bacterium]|nr:O-antigen ligase family protein [Bacteroidales bacterium]
MAFLRNIKTFLSGYFGTRREEVHFNVYILALTLLAIGLPVSRFLMSVSMFILSINWIAEGHLTRKMKVLWSRKSLLFMISVYLLHAAGMAWSSDLAYGMHDLKVKLPYLIILLVVGTSREIPLPRLKSIFKYYILSVFVATLIITAIFIVTQKSLNDSRNISVFISHIRFSLMIVMAVLIIMYTLLFGKFSLNKREKTVLPLLVIWLSAFLFILQSFTGIWIYMLSVSLLVIIFIIKQKKKPLTIAVAIIFVLVAFFTGNTVFKALSSFYPSPGVNIKMLDKYTANGNPYFHDIKPQLIENRNYVYLYLCIDELRKEWNRRSTLGFDSLDHKGQHLSQTLVRYMTSKGLRKDSAGVAALSPHDITMIENGFSNHIFSKKFSIYPRIYQFFWEIDVYRKTGISGGHSLTQRIEYLKNGMKIIKRNFWFGVGTGDVKMEYKNQYKKSGTNLDERWRLRAHNQFITFIISFGIAGFLWILFSFVFAVFYEKKNNDLITLIFLLVIFLSMLNEDTLETMAGIVFFSLFFALFVFEYKSENAA